MLGYFYKIETSRCFVFCVHDRNASIIPVYWARTQGTKFVAAHAAICQAKKKKKTACLAAASEWGAYARHVHLYIYTMCIWPPLNPRTVLTNKLCSPTSPNHHASNDARRVHGHRVPCGQQSFFVFDFWFPSPSFPNGICQLVQSLKSLHFVVFLSIA